MKMNDKDMVGVEAGLIAWAVAWIENHPAEMAPYDEQRLRELKQHVSSN
jgi:hypothetical protein